MHHQINQLNIIIMKKSIKLKVLKNPNIKVGDRVKLVDGSALTPVKEQQVVHIMYSYPHITGLEKRLEDIEGIVTSVNLSEYVCESGNDSYLQDIVVCLGQGLFRTCSKLVSIS